MKKKNDTMKYIGIGCIILATGAVIIGFLMYRGCAKVIEVGKGVTVNEVRSAILDNLPDTTSFVKIDEITEELDKFKDNVDRGKIKLADILDISDNHDKIMSDSVVTAQEVQKLLNKVKELNLSAK